LFVSDLSLINVVYAADAGAQPYCVLVVLSIVKAATWRVKQQASTATRCFGVVPVGLDATMV